MANWTIEKWKSLVEIFAILAAGIFAFMTWGLDEVRLREPHWSIYVDSVYEDVVSSEGRDVCDYKGTVNIKNISKTPLYIRDTIIDFLILPRPVAPNGNGGVTESSLYSLTKKMCPDLKKCGGSIHTTTIGSLDNFPVPSGETATRPFHIQFDESAIVGNSNNIKDALSDKVLLIRIQQQIGGYGVSEKDLAIPVSSYYDPDVCNIKVLPNKPAQPTLKSSAAGL